MLSLLTFRPTYIPTPRTLHIALTLYELFHGELRAGVRVHLHNLQGGIVLVVLAVNIGTTLDLKKINKFLKSRQKYDLTITYIITTHLWLLNLLDKDNSPAVKLCTYLLSLPYLH